MSTGDRTAVGRVAARVVLVTALAATASACGAAVGSQQTGGSAGQEPVNSRLVLVSGRDDHGELRHPRVPLFETAAGEHVVATADDGTLATVVATEGQMLEVATVDGERVTGWVDDFYLRGTLHLVGPAPTCRARLAGELQEAGLQVVVRSVRGGQALVESVADPATRGWVDRDAVQELPPRSEDCSGGGGGSHTH